MAEPLREIGILLPKKTVPAPHLAHPEGCAALRIVRVTVPCVSRSGEHFPDGFDLQLLRATTNPLAAGCGLREVSLPICMEKVPD